MANYTPWVQREEQTLEPDARYVAQARPDPGRRPFRTPDPVVAACFFLPFIVVVYLGMKSGGFDNLIYGQVGILAWWIVILGVIAGIQPALRVSRAGWVAIALLGGFTTWTMAAMTWSSSSERTMIEIGRVAAYLGIFVLAVLIAGRDRLRPMLAGVGAGCATIAAVALLSRFEPNWFPENQLANVLPSTESRLAYPLNYWNGLAGLLAIGLPLMVWMSTTSRSVLARATAASLVPIMVLTTYYTLSRGGTIAGALGLIALIVLSERRISLLPVLGVLAAGSAMLVWAAEQRPSLQSGVVDETAMAQGDRMLLIVVGVGFVVGLSIVGISLAAHRGRLPNAPTVPRRAAAVAVAVAAGVAIAGFLLGGGPERLNEGWESFKEPSNPGAQVERLSSASGNGRWQYWSAAIGAFASEPIHGNGPGTFVFYWSEHKDISGFVRDAHSLFAETLAELGVVGLALIGGFVLFALVGGVRRSLVADHGERQALAAATAAALAFAVAAGIDWLWEVAVVPVAFLWVVAAILRSDDAEPASLRTDAGRRTRSTWLARIAVGGIAVVLAGTAIALIAIPMYGSRAVAESQALFRAGNYAESLSRAEDAADLQPYAASPLIQKAFAHEQLGELAKAAAAARAATEAESTNWETWFVLSREQGLRGKEGAALVALRRAQDLDPLSSVLNPGEGGRLRTSRPGARGEDRIAEYSATDFDPVNFGGDGEEHADDTTLAIDESRETGWATENYTAGLAGVPKDGVGIYLDAGEPVTPRRMALLTDGGGWTYEIYGSGLDTAPTDISGWGHKLTGGLTAERRQVVGLKTREPNRYFLVWITGINGGRAQIFDIRLLG